MKLIIITLFGFFFLGLGNCYAQTKQPKKSNYSNRKDDDCMLNGVYGKPLEITDHTVDNKKSTHQKTDYIQFNEDGSYIEFVNGTQNKGTWTYDSTAKTIKVECNGTHVYKLTSGPKGSFELNKQSTKMTIKPKS